MSEWTQPEDGSTIIAHISDLHFGSANQLDSWKLLDKCLRNTINPDLILATGDIVETPSSKNYESARTALDSLGKPYRVCAGNHDRHSKGNRFWRIGTKHTSALFDRIFIDRIATPEIRPIEFANLRIGLLGVDSSEKADYFARGYMDPIIFPDIEKQTLNSDFDFVILLIHHHLQSVRMLEERHRGDIKALTDLTCMVNSGTFLESLARAHVDLVLHGHEHCPHWSRYGSVEGRRGELCVIGAGSATGNDSLHGCGYDRMSFNVIILSPHRSATLRIMKWKGGNWNVDDTDLLLFDARSARQLRLLRRAQNVKSELNSHVIKYVRFSRDRDILVHWVFKNWFLEKEHFSQDVENSTGWPEEPSITVSTLRGDHFTVPNLAFSKHPNLNQVWVVEGTVPKEFLKIPVQVDFHFKWRGGGLLTKDELVLLNAGNSAGLMRKKGFEYSTIYTKGAVASAQLVLEIAREYAPPADGQNCGIEIHVLDEDLERQPTEEQELLDGLVTLDPGRYSLTVPYPREEWAYVLAWKPVVRPTSSDGEALFKAAATQRASELLLEFRKGLAPLSSASSARLALYIMNGNQTEAYRVGLLKPTGTESELPYPVEKLSLKGDRSLLGQAFWGVAGGMKRPENGPPGDDFLEDELAVLALPLRFGFGWTNPAPWGIIRIGVTSADNVNNLLNADDLDMTLAAGATRLLTKALTKSF